MNKMTVALIGIKFDSNKKSSTVSIKLPKQTKILSVQAQNAEYTLWIHFMCPPACLNCATYNEYSFIIAKCCYTEIELDRHQYIGHLNIGNDTYVVFYQKEATS